MTFATTDLAFSIKSPFFFLSQIKFWSNPCWASWIRGKSITGQFQVEAKDHQLLDEVMFPNLKSLAKINLPQLQKRLLQSMFCLITALPLPTTWIVKRMLPLTYTQMSSPPPTLNLTVLLQTSKAKLPLLKLRRERINFQLWPMQHVCLSFSLLRTRQLSMRRTVQGETLNTPLPLGIFFA